MLFAKQNELSAEELINLCKKLSTVQSSSDVALEELEGYCDELAIRKKDLEQTITKLDSHYNQSKNDLSNMLKKKGLAEEQVQNIDHMLEFLKTIGYDLSDLNSIYDMLQNAKTKNYDISEIINHLNQEKSLESALQEKQSRLVEIETNTRKSIKKHEELLLKHENLALRHDSMLKSIKSVEYLEQKRVSADMISIWQKIFDSFGLDQNEFARELNDLGDKSKLIANLDGKKSQLAKDVVRLEKKKIWLENNTNNLISEISNGIEFGKKNLKKIADHAESQINHATIHTKKSLDDLIRQNQVRISFTQKQFDDYFLDLVSKFESLLEKSYKAECSLREMESLKPLFDLINGKFDPATSISQVIIILDKLYVNIKDTDLDKFMFSSDIKRLREKLLDLISHG